MAGQPDNEVNALFVATGVLHVDLMLKNKYLVPIRSRLFAENSL